MVATKYDGGMKRANWALVAGSVLLLAGSSLAQINAAPPSVTSLGFGGRAINGTPPSVTSLGPRGYTPGFNPAFPNSYPNLGSNHHHHHRNGTDAVYAVPYAYGYYGYYGYDNGDDPNAAEDEQYNGGPTVFDRRGPGPAPRAEQAYSGNEVQPPSVSDSERPEEPPAENQPETVLVFKDGHQIEVANYAIVGPTLYDLTDGRRHKIPLSDLDLDATAKQNDDRGVDFEVPSGS